MENKLRYEYILEGMSYALEQLKEHPTRTGEELYYFYLDIFKRLINNLQTTKDVNFIRILLLNGGFNAKEYKEFYLRRLVNEIRELSYETMKKERDGKKNY